MRSTFLFLVFLILGNPGYAQLVEPLFFNKKIHDFGEIIEADGAVEFEFTFTNNSVRPVKILSVQASCGCTTPGWSAEPVAVGKAGSIKASFDPKSRPGYFNKSLTVTTDLDKAPIVLQIKGSVVDKRTATDRSLSAVNGNLRLKNNSFNLGKIYVNKPAVTQEFEIMNAGPVKFDFTKIEAPAYIKIETPVSLKPAERGEIKVTYDAKLRNQYGFLSDKIDVHTTDSMNPIKSFSVYATAEEYFPLLTTAEQAKAPSLLISTYAIDFARVKKGAVIEQSFTFQNKGKLDLEIRHIQSNCSCLIATAEKKKIKPGESTSIKWVFTTSGRTGTQNKAITIYSNDPRNPVQRVTFSGYIED